MAKMCKECGELEKNCSCESSSPTTKSETMRQLRKCLTSHMRDINMVDEQIEIGNIRIYDSNFRFVLESTDDINFNDDFRKSGLEVEYVGTRIEDRTIFTHAYIEGDLELYFGDDPVDSDYQEKSELEKEVEEFIERFKKFKKETDNDN